MVEAVLRAEFQSRLRPIFPSTDDESWINHYSSGSEAHTKIGMASGKSADRFINNLIGSTTIEYEADLRIQAKRAEGFGQVRDHAAGLVRSGVPASQVRGILSDTVDWYAYDVQLAPGATPGSCLADDITLVAVDELLLASNDESSSARLIDFVRKHLAREKSRPLRAEFLTLDLGLNSGPYRRSAPPLVKLVTDGRAVDTSILLATDLWSQFVDYLEGEPGAFRAAAYADEAYLCMLARLLSANVLADQALSSDDAELATILDGSYFYNHYHLSNMVELDYFGWLTNAHHLSKLIPVAREVQRDLHAYDFSTRPEQDLFGRLMAELARRSQRKLLGQEWTPAWLSRQVAERCLDGLPAGESPRIIDMCCGSGSILAETLKVARDRLGLTGIAALHEVATGFDIDPLAVSLSKTTWVVTLAAEIKAATSPITILVYHADSLFAVTPVSAALPFFGLNDTIDLSLDGVTVKLPSTLVQPAYRDLFDRIVDWAYDEAIAAQKSGQTASITKAHTVQFLSGAAAASGAVLPEDFGEALAGGLHALVKRMVALALANRNGIWAFILRNTYRPGLLTGQFNGLVSNPPWLAMSGMADNPYRTFLTARARLYGIRPAGQSFLHLELGTTHLLHAVDRYLKPGASIACLVPGTIFNGHHHERLRRRGYLNSKRSVALEISEVWQVAPGTFKYPDSAIVGHKRASTAGLAATPVAGFFAGPTGLIAADFSVQALGSQRTAWVLAKEGMPVADGGMGALPQQGADLMPRTAVCIDVERAAGAEHQVNTPDAASPWFFVVKAAKELKSAQFPGYVAPRYIYRMAQSENLLPFTLGVHCAPIAIPAERDLDGAWRILDEANIRRSGLTETARRFGRINTKLARVGQGKSLQARIDERGKLSKQHFGKGGHIILAGAGGKHICAACLPVTEADDLVVDQTLYWKVFIHEEVAWFCVGMLNSHAMTKAIAPFNPKGAFGERHIHALPYRLIPAFDSANEEHQRIAALARELARVARTTIKADAYLSDPSRALTARRTRLRTLLSDTEQMCELDSLCAAILGTTVSAEDDLNAVEDDD